MRDVTELVGVSRMTIYRWCRSGDFPPPHRLGARCIGWYREEIEQWRATRPVALTTG
ncbi:MAG: AlpA family phage regulatory protein [Chloroflexota bacterium]|nr:AlpA family phage regulatory protein [Chloroflexota bacterium]